MLSTIRQFQKGILIVVTVLIVIAFAFLYSDYDFVKGTVGSNDCVIKVGGRCYRLEEAQKLARFHDLAEQLMLGDFARTLRGPNRTDRDPTNFVMNLIVLRKEAAAMGIEPSPDEIKEALPRLPVLAQMQWMSGDQKSRMIQNLLGGMGLDQGDLAQLMKDYLAFNKLRGLLGSGIQAVPSAVEKSYIQLNQRFTASVINFDRSDFEKEVKVSDEEIKAYFDERNKPAAPALPKTLEPAEDPEAGLPKPEEEKTESNENPGELRTAPQRGFDYVKFIPRKLAEDATREEKAKADVAFAKAVNRIYSELASEDVDFVKQAEEFAKEKTTFELKIGSLKPFKQDEPPAELKELPSVVNALFSETLEKDEVSVPEPGEDGSYLVFKFSELVEPRPMTLEEAKPLIETLLKAKKSNQLASDAANAALAKLGKTLEEKKSILDAASANNYDLVTLPGFSETEPPASEVEDGPLVLASVRDIGPGQLSPVMERTNGKGYFITYVDKIEIYKDENKDDNLKMLANTTERAEEQNLFLAWLKQRGKEHGAARNDSILNYRVR